MGVFDWDAKVMAGLVLVLAAGVALLLLLNTSIEGFTQQADETGGFVDDATKAAKEAIKEHGGNSAGFGSIGFGNIDFDCENA